MPELPEVETVRAGLARHLLTQPVIDAEFFHPRATRHSPGGEDHILDVIAGTRLEGVVRRGKYLWWELSDRAEALVIHLGMSGQILIDPRPGMPTHHRRARFHIGEHDVWFVDQRTFGHLLVSPLVPTNDGKSAGWGSSAALIPEVVSHIARDPLDDHYEPAATARAIRGRTTSIKRALLDQSLIAGIGNIYADEALWRARIHPRRATATMTQRAVLGLLGHVRDVLAEALAAGGTSFDALYVDTSGRSGYFARELNAYGRTGAPCPRCGRPIVRESFANRSSHRCPSCQRLPAPAHLAKC